MKIPFLNRELLSLKEMQGFKDKMNAIIRVNEMLNLQITKLTEDQYTGNAYTKYENAVKEIQNKYNATADWGVSLTGNIIDLRAAFIISNGLTIIPAKNVKITECEKELQWCEDFLEYNDLDREYVQDLAKEAEIEGKIALKLDLIKEPDWKKEYQMMITVNYLSWLDTQYTIKTPKDNVMEYESLEYKGKDGKPVKIERDKFVYNKFGGRIYNPNQAQPKVMKCLTEIDDVSKALRDWRELNHKFSFPVPDAECEQEKDVTAAKEALDNLNVKIGRGFAHSKSKFEYKSPPMTGRESLIQEIETKIKIISGTTGVPIHFLGLLDLLKNRATGETVQDMIIPATEKERSIWKGTWREVLQKGMIMYNKESKQTQLDPYKIDVDIVMITREQWEHLEKVFIPMYLAGAISLEYLLSQVPGIDVDEELKRQQGENGVSLDKNGNLV